jgi:hypothetical protein
VLGQCDSATVAGLSEDDARGQGRVFGTEGCRDFAAANYSYDTGYYYYDSGY